MADGSMIALTGATGFTGQRFLAAALEQGYRVRVLVRDVDVQFPSGVEVAQCDFSSDDPIAPDALAGCDTLVHLAAYRPRDHDDIVEARRCWQINAWGTLALVDAAVRAGVGRIVQTCSANAFRSNDTAVDEQAPIDFHTHAAYYLTSKVAQETYAQARTAGDDTGVAALRVSSIYGPGAGGGLLPVLARRLLDGEPIDLVDNGAFAADFVHVDDVVAALFLSIESDLDGPVNIASGQRRTLREAVDHMLDATGADPALVRRVDGQGAAPQLPMIDISHARSLGFDPMSLMTGIDHMVRAMRDEASA